MLQDQKTPSINKPVDLPPKPVAPAPIKAAPAPKPVAPAPKPEPPKPVTKIIDLKLPAAPRDCVEQILEYTLLDKNIKLTLPSDQPSVGVEVLVAGTVINISYINRSGYCGSRVQINPLH